MPAHALALHRGLHRHGGLVRHHSSGGPSVLERLHDKAVRANRQLARTSAVHDDESMLDDHWKAHLSEVAIIGATTFTVGIIQGRYGKDALKLGPVPMDLPVGAVLVGASILRPVGRLSLPMRAVGAALVGAHSMTWGRGVGKWWRTQANQPPLIEGEAAARVPPVGGGALTDEELASVARRA